MHSRRDLDDEKTKVYTRTTQKTNLEIRPKKKEEIMGIKKERSSCSHVLDAGARSMDSSLATTQHSVTLLTYTNGVFPILHTHHKTEEKYLNIDKFKYLVSHQYITGL
jgi:hypothetical protein